MSSASSIATDLQQHRQQFPSLSNKLYFNYGGQGPMPQRAIAAIHQSQDYIQTAGPFSGGVNAWVTQEANQTRRAIAAQLNAPVEAIALTEDVSVGCNIPLWGMDWRAGDHILLSDCEHPGIIAAAQEIGRRFGVALSTCPLMATLNAGDPVAVISEHLRPTTRLLIVSHILWNTGQVLPLAEIIAACQKHVTQTDPVRVLVDAAQSVGVLPLNLTELGADFYAFTGHKWWCGPAGVGGLYVRPDLLESLNPTFIGWRGITKNAAGHPTGWLSDGRKFEVATSDFALYAGLREAIATHQQWGTPAERYQRICTLSQYLWHRLGEFPQITRLKATPPAAGLVSFQVSGLAHKQLVDALERQNLMLRTILDPDCVRACVHYFTLETEIDRLIEAIANLMQASPLCV
jgi:L-cysteine/cystine lyase